MIQKGKRNNQFTSSGDVTRSEIEEKYQREKQVGRNQLQIRRNIVSTRKPMKNQYELKVKY